MEQSFSQNKELFSSPEEELAYLRERVQKQEQVLKQKGENPDREELIMKELKEYTQSIPEKTLAKGFQMIEPHQQAIVLDLIPETHDDKMSELLGLLHDKGFLNTLSVVEKLGNPHIESDFHRFLVEYIKKGFEVKGASEKSPIYKALRHTLYEVSLPRPKKEEKERQLKEVISSMEQFYAGMLSVSTEAERNTENFFSIELAISNDSQEFVFYASVPDSKTNLFEKQLLSVFAGAKIVEKKDDYNVFNAEGITVASVAKQKNKPIFPIKTYEQFDYDPLNIVLNTLSKIDKSGEGASIQLVINPSGDYYLKPFKNALEQIHKGVKVKDAIDTPFTAGQLMKKELKEIGKTMFDEVFKRKDDKKKDEEKFEKKGVKPEDQKVLEQIEQKISSPVTAVNIRIVASAPSRHRAEEILSDIESSFNQFENTTGNALSFDRVSEKDLSKTVRNFSFRMFDDSQALPMNLREISSILHFPGQSIVEGGQLKQSKASTAPAPLDAPREGVYLGVNKHRNQEVPIYMTPEDRLRHFYVIGQTGTGKTTLLKDMIIQDIKNGEGVCFIDPHGSDVQDILAHIPPERFEDVIYFDPSYIPRPMGMNMLEYDPAYPEQKTFVVNELFSIFDKLFDMKTTGGPMFEQYFRNSTMLVLEDPESGNTLLDVSRVLSNKAYRELKISRCKNPIVVQFWKEVAEKAGGESSLANIVPYITSKFDVFLANDIMRPLIAQEKSSFDFRKIMDEKKILLVNLSKGRLGDINANLIGLILVGKILMAALSRVDSMAKGFPPFYLYIDEFQNVTTNSISVILSEARKYKLSLHIAHQFIAQLKEDIRDAVFGNVGSIVSYRVGADDAEYLQKQFEPVFTSNDIMNLDNLNAYSRLLINGRPARPFNITVPFPPVVDKSHVQPLKELSYLKYGGDREEIEEMVMKKYRKEPPPAPAPSPFPAAESQLKKALNPFLEV